MLDYLLIDVIDHLHINIEIVLIMLENILVGVHLSPFIINFYLKKIQSRCKGLWEIGDPYQLVTSKIPN